MSLMLWEEEVVVASSEMVALPSKKGGMLEEVVTVMFLRFALARFQFG